MCNVMVYGIHDPQVTYMMQGLTDSCDVDVRYSCSRAMKISQISVLTVKKLKDNNVLKTDL